MEKIKIYSELRQGGEWLGSARSWMQSNIPRGDTICWSSGELVSIPFCKLEEFAMAVAVAAVAEERKKQAKKSPQTPCVVSDDGV